MFNMSKLLNWIKDDKVASYYNQPNKTLMYSAD